MGSTLKVGGVIVEVDGLCRGGNSIPRGIDFKGTNLTLAVRVCSISAFMLLPLLVCTLLHLRLNKEGVSRGDKI